MEGGGLSLLRNKALGGIKRIKISRACDECRKRKVKCDGVQPCGRCRKSNAECVFAKLPPKRGPPKQYMESLENRLQRVEKALKSMTAPVRKVFEEALATEKHRQSLELNNIPMIPEVSYHSHHKKSVSYSAPYTSDMSHIARFTINEIGQAVYVNDLKVRIDRIPNENQQHVNDTQSDISDSSTSSFFHPSQQSLQPLPPVTPSQTMSDIPIPDHLSSRPLVSEVQPLTEIYFDHVHKYVPMIHKPTFLKQMHSLSNPPSRLLLYAMCAVASRWSFPMDNKLPPGYTHYQRAIEILDEFLDIPRVSTVQALILLVKYQEYYQRIGYFHRSSFYLNIACTMCQDLGLSELDSDCYDVETKRRTFWVTFMYDLLSSIEQGNEPFFQVKKCKTGFPLVTHEEGPALEELIINQNIYIQLGKVLSDIYSMSRRLLKRQKLQLNQKSGEQTVEEQTRLFSLHTHLENFLYEVPPTLIYSPTQDVEHYPVEKQLIHDPFVGFLHMTYHITVILLHRNYISIPPPKTEYNFVTYHHRKLCASSASNITMIAETMYERYPTFTFHYPMRGVQHTVYCLATAATIHKYEMLNGQDELIRDIAKRQYLTSLEIIQYLSNESPSIELSNYFNQPVLNEPALYQSSASIVPTNEFYNLSEWSTTTPEFSMQLNNWNQPMYSYPQLDIMSTGTSNNNGRIRRHTVSTQQPYYPIQPISSSSSSTMINQQDVKKSNETNFDPNLNMDMMVAGSEEDTLMMDNHHYDPTPGMSQLFLTDDQQQQQQMGWDGSIISDTKSEGHVLK